MFYTPLWNIAFAATCFYMNDKRGGAIPPYWISWRILKCGKFKPAIYLGFLPLAVHLDLAVKGTQVFSG